MTDSELMQLSEQVGQALKARGATVTTAESCTGGWVAKVITDHSPWFLYREHDEKYSRYPVSRCLWSCG
ncbi:protein YgaD [Escherichia coli O157:H7 str. EC4401]|nr:protein YgaD [Escherichia coli O157:H7 str. EC4401]